MAHFSGKSKTLIIFAKVNDQPINDCSVASTPETDLYTPGTKHILTIHQDDQGNFSCTQTQ